MRDYLVCWGRGDVEAASQFWADDVELVLNGRNPMSGTYHGKAAYREYVRKLYALVAGRATLVTVYGNFADEHRAVNLIRVRFERPARSPSRSTAPPSSKSKTARSSGRRCSTTTNTPSTSFCRTDAPMAPAAQIGRQPPICRRGCHPP